MTNVIGIKFKEGGKVYYFDPNGIEVELDQFVIVETARGAECGTVALTAQDVPDSDIVKPLKKVIRAATKKDIAQAAENRRKEEKAFGVCQQKILDHNLEMKLVDVECAFDGSKILFYFTAEGRVDFRELVKDLAGVFRTRIELRQIGVRDEAKMLGGLGICGREFCCSSFLADFQPVSIRMAKEQGLPLNPTKISGACGRLMCCLKYEQEAYEDLIRTTPRVNASVDTPEGRGTVIDVSLLTGMLKVRLDGENGEVHLFHKSDVAGGIRCPKRRPEQPLDDEDAVPAAEEIPASVPAEVDALSEAAPAGEKPHRSRRSRGGRPRFAERPAAESQEKVTENAPAPADSGDKPQRPRRPRRRRRPNSNGAPQQ